MPYTNTYPPSSWTCSSTVPSPIRLYNIQPSIQLINQPNKACQLNGVMLNYCFPLKSIDFTNREERIRGKDDAGSTDYFFSPVENFYPVNLMNNAKRPNSFYYIYLYTFKAHYSKTSGLYLPTLIPGRVTISLHQSRPESGTFRSFNSIGFYNREIIEIRPGLAGAFYNSSNRIIRRRFNV